jgi:hypothetical protein
LSCSEKFNFAVVLPYLSSRLFEPECFVTPVSPAAPEATPLRLRVSPPLIAASELPVSILAVRMTGSAISFSLFLNLIFLKFLTLKLFFYPV